MSRSKFTLIRWVLYVAIGLLVAVGGRILMNENR